MLFACYRRGDANEPDGYVRAITAVLSMYETDLVREVTDPRTGVMTNEKYMSFMPNAGELKVYCDGVAKRKAHFKRLGDLKIQPRPLLSGPDTQPGSLANLFVPSSNRRFDALVEWATTQATDQRLFRFDEERGGLWISQHIWETGTPKVRGETFKRPEVQLEPENVSRETESSDAA